MPDKKVSQLTSWVPLWTDTAWVLVQWWVSKKYTFNDIPVSTATTTALDNKVDKITWKRLSTEDYSTAEKSKLAWIEAWAEVNNISDINATDLTDWWATTLHKHSYNDLDNKPTIPTKTSDLTNDSLLSDITAGTNITIDKTDPRNPVIYAVGGSGSGQAIYDAIVAPIGWDYTTIEAALRAGKYKLWIKWTILTSFLLLDYAKVSLIWLKDAILQGTDTNNDVFKTINNDLYCENITFDAQTNNCLASMVVWDWQIAGNPDASKWCRNAFYKCKFKWGSKDIFATYLAWASYSAWLQALTAFENNDLQDWNIFIDCEFDTQNTNSVQDAFVFWLQKNMIIENCTFRHWKVSIYMDRSTSVSKLTSFDSNSQAFFIAWPMYDCNLDSLVSYNSALAWFKFQNQVEHLPMLDWQANKRNNFSNFISYNSWDIWFVFEDCRDLNIVNFQEFESTSHWYYLLRNEKLNFVNCKSTNHNTWDSSVWAWFYFVVGNKYNNFTNCISEDNRTTALSRGWFVDKEDTSNTNNTFTNCSVLWKNKERSFWFRSDYNKITNSYAEWWNYAWIRFDWASRCIISNYTWKNNTNDANNAFYEIWLQNGASYNIIINNNIISDATNKMASWINIDWTWCVWNVIWKQIITWNQGVKLLDTWLSTDKSLFNINWNADEDTIDITQSWSVLQVWQETQYQIKWDEVTWITNWQLVMASWTDWNSWNIKGKKAISDWTYDPKYILWIATQDIASWVFWKVTQFWKVRWIQTNWDNYWETWLEWDILFPNQTTAGWLTKVIPQAPNWKNAVAIVISVHWSNWTLFVRVNPLPKIWDLNNVDITTEVTWDLLVRNWTHWINSPVMTETKTWTWFVDNENITVTWNSINRTVTLSHWTNVIYYWRWQRKVLWTSWTSTRHWTDTSKRYFLYTTDWTNFTWSETAWDFTDTMVALTFYDTTLASWIYIREVHWTYDHESHRIDHNNIWTFRLSWWNPTTWTFALNTTTDIAITPWFDSAVVADEDLLTAIQTVTEWTYTIWYTNASNIMVFDTTKTFPFNNTASWYINYFLNWVSTQWATRRFYNVYQILIPVWADTNSQKFRTVFLQPQAQYTTLSAAQSEDFRRLNLWNFANLSPESVAYTRLTYWTNASYWTTWKVQLNWLSYLLWSRATQLSISWLTPLTLSWVLRNGNDAGWQSITGLANLTMTWTATIRWATVTWALQVWTWIDTAQITTPSNPASWRNKIYTKADNKVYLLTSAWVETEIGAWSGWWTQMYEWNIDWQTFTWMIARFTVKVGQTIAWVKITGSSLPTWSDFTLDVRKNWTATTNSIFTSDTGISITTGQSATNWVYTTTKTTIDNGTCVENDVLYVYITSAWSTLPLSDLYFLIY